MLLETVLRNPKAKKHTATATPERSRELMSKPQMLAAIGDPAYSTVWGWMKDGFFPLPIELGPPNSRSTMIAWYADEVRDWIANRPRRQLGVGQHEFRGIRAAEKTPPAVKLAPIARRKPKPRVKPSALAESSIKPKINRTVALGTETMQEMAE